MIEATHRPTIHAFLDVSIKTAWLKKGLSVKSREQAIQDRPSGMRGEDARKVDIVYRSNEMRSRQVWSARKRLSAILISTTLSITYLSQFSSFFARRPSTGQSVPPAIRTARKEKKKE
jgi:hypothetical protein